MIDPHRIRIRGPWQYQLEDGSEGSMKIPGLWQGEATAVRFLRRFNWLAELEPQERVLLVFTGYGGTGLLEVNGTKLGELSGGPAEFDVTNLLQPRNDIALSLSMHAVEPPRGLWGDVVLEVRVVDRDKQNAETTQ